MDKLQPWVDKGVAAHDRLMAVPGVRPWTEDLLLLAGLSTAFWILSKLLGRVALLIHASLDESLGDLFAVVYNIALALLYSSVLVQAAISERGGQDSFLAFQAAGFVTAYLVLGATYRERSGHISEHALPGYWAGLLGYLFFCLRTQYLANPATREAYAAVSFFLKSGLGRYVTYFAVAAAITGALRRLWLALPKPRLGRRRK